MSGCYLTSTVVTNDNVRQIQTPDYENPTNRQGIHVPIMTSKDTYQIVKIRQDDKPCISVPHNYKETDQRQDLNDYEPG